MISQRRVLRTEASTAARSHGATVRRSTTSIDPSRSRAARSQRSTMAPHVTTVSRFPARTTLALNRLTVVTWGAMVERCERAARDLEGSIEVVDLRTVAPWDRAAVLASVRKTRRWLIIHEDPLTGGFGVEVAAVVAEEAFLSLDAPISRLAIADVPTPYNVNLMNAVLPGVEG